MQGRGVDTPKPARAQAGGSPRSAARPWASAGQPPGRAWPGAQAAAESSSARACAASAGWPISSSTAFRPWATRRSLATSDAATAASPSAMSSAKRSTQPARKRSNSSRSPAKCCCTGSFGSNPAGAGVAPGHNSSATVSSSCCRGTGLCSTRATPLANRDCRRASFTPALKMIQGGAAPACAWPWASRVSAEPSGSIRSLMTSCQSPSARAAAAAARSRTTCSDTAGAAASGGDRSSSAISTKRAMDGSSSISSTRAATAALSGGLGGGVDVRRGLRQQARQFRHQGGLVHQGHALQRKGIGRALGLIQCGDDDEPAACELRMRTQAGDQRGAIDARQQDVDQQQVRLQSAGHRQARDAVGRDMQLRIRQFALDDEADQVLEMHRVFDQQQRQRPARRLRLGSGRRGRTGLGGEPGIQ
mmetsp:Transcript_5566/g.21443  ORF Transcript_5566/g.21443 Transcript_5566/m.21443 type:complete len:419 (+) Transcript_5566:732-1988(+)